MHSAGLFAFCVFCISLLSSQKEEELLHTPDCSVMNLIYHNILKLTVQHVKNLNVKITNTKINIQATQIMVSKRSQYDEELTKWCTFK